MIAVMATQQLLKMSMIIMMMMMSMIIVMMMILMMAILLMLASRLLQPRRTPLPLVGEPSGRRRRAQWTVLRGSYRQMSATVLYMPN